MIDPNQKLERARVLMEAELDEELVALDTEGGFCYGFNAIAASVWRQLERPRSMAELVDGFLQDFEVERQQCEADLADLLQQLAKQGLIRPAGQSQVV